jgi:hypothetical protein
MAKGEKHSRNSGPKKSRDNRQRSRGPFDPQNLGAEADQNANDHPGRELRPLGPNEKVFNILIDSVPYIVRAAPFSFNDETRYRVSFNGSPEHIFTWDSSLGQLRAINEESSTIPDNLEIAISEKLQSKA